MKRWILRLGIGIYPASGWEDIKKPSLVFFPIKVQKSDKTDTSSWLDTPGTIRDKTVLSLVFSSAQVKGVKGELLRLDLKSKNPLSLVFTLLFLEKRMIIEFKEHVQKYKLAAKLQCDVCKKIYDDELEIQEFHFINFYGGYSSVFGDELNIVCDVCQHCLKEFIDGKYRVEA